MRESELDSLPPVDRLRAIMAALRGEGGCPWDRKQTLVTLKPYLVEEAYEVLDAIDSGDRAQLCEELGDLLLQVVFQSQLCAEEEAFDLDDVATSICDKLIRRHPHVFGDVDVADADEVLKNWDAIKQTEKGGGEIRSAMEGVPRSLPALHRAHEIQKRAARQGFDWDDVADVLAKVDEELGELRQAMADRDEPAAREELGDLLFSVVNLGRFLGHQPEEALHETIHKFVSRFQYIEDRVQAEGKVLTELDLPALDRLWDEAKDGEP